MNRIALTSLWIKAALAISSPVMATNFLANNQLGQNRPATPNLSTSPYWHVYKFLKDGIEYLQVNDLGDTPRVAVAVAHEQALVLPIGNDVQRVRVYRAADRIPSRNTKHQHLMCSGGCVNQIQSQSPTSALSLLSDRKTQASTIYQDSSLRIATAPGDDGDHWQVQTMPPGPEEWPKP